MVENGCTTRLFGAWLILVAISLGYLWIDHLATHRGMPTASTIVTVFAICFALIKVRIIMREFMDVRNAPTVLRRLTDFWLLLMAVALLGAYFAGMAVA
jgi:hypothetical protein